MRFPRRVTILGFIILASLLSKGPIACKATGPAVQSPSSKPDARVRRIHDLINRFRASQGLKPLHLDSFLSKIAAEHSQNMAERKVDFGHQGFEERAKAIQAKMQYRSTAENVGLSMGKVDDPEDVVVKGWLKSPGHLKNIKGDFERTGIGVAKKGKDEYYFTQIFLKRLE